MNIHLISASKMASEHSESTVEIKSEDVNNEEAAETIIPHILHNEHSPSICALQVQIVYERYLRQEKHLLEILDRNCKQIEENGRLTVENLESKVELKASVSKIGKMKEEVQNMEKELRSAKEKVTRLQEAQLDASVLKEDIEIELDHAKAAKKDLVEQLERVQNELAHQKELTAKANSKLSDALKTNYSQKEAALQCMKEAQLHVSQKDQEIANEYEFSFEI
jgi:chromosome segregation ATPase